MSDNNASNSSIFEDLGITFTGETITKYEAAMGFADEVYAADKMLRDILSPEVTPVSKIEQKAKDEWRDGKEHRQTLKQIFDTPTEGKYGYDNPVGILTWITEQAESIDLAVLFGLTEVLERLTSDLKNTLHVRAQMESSAMDESIVNKKLAQVLHKRLREASTPAFKFINMMAVKPAVIDASGKEIEPARRPNLQPIKAVSGNFAVSIMDPVAWYFPNNDEPYFMHSTVARKLGIYYDGIKFQDVVEYCEKHVDLVEMKRVKM